MPCMHLCGPLAGMHLVVAGSAKALQVVEIELVVRVIGPLSQVMHLVGEHGPAFALAPLAERSDRELQSPHLPPPRRVVEPLRFGIPAKPVIVPLRSRTPLRGTGWTIGRYPARQPNRNGTRIERTNQKRPSVTTVAETRYLTSWAMMPRPGPPAFAHRPGSTAAPRPARRGGSPPACPDGFAPSYRRGPAPRHEQTARGTWPPSPDPLPKMVAWSSRRPACRYPRSRWRFHLEPWSPGRQRRARRHYTSEDTYFTVNGKMVIRPRPGPFGLPAGAFAMGVRSVARGNFWRPKLALRHRESALIFLGIGPADRITSARLLIVEPLDELSQRVRALAVVVIRDAAGTLQVPVTPLDADALTHAKTGLRRRRRQLRLRFHSLRNRRHAGPSQSIRGRRRLWPGQAIG